MPKDIVLRCSICGLPYARISNGVVLIESRHHGESHTNAVPVANLVSRVWGGSDGDKDDWPPKTEKK